MPSNPRLAIAAVLAAILSLIDGAAPAQTPERPLYPGAGSGPHYWIDGQLGNDSNPGSAAQPWRSLDKLELVTLPAGSLVHVQPGTYTMTTALRFTGKSGTPSQWIGIEAEGPVVLQNAVAQNIIEVSDCRYLFLRGFEIRHDNGGAAYGGWSGVDGIKFQNAGSDHVAIDSCRIHDVGNAGINSQVTLATDLVVYNCEIWNCYLGIYWGYYESTDKKAVHGGRIARCHVHHCPPVDLDGTGYGIQIKGGCHGNVIEDNVVTHSGGNTRAGIAIYHASDQAAVATQPNVIRRNLVNAARNEGIYAVEGAVIESNIVVDSGTYGIHVSPRATGWGTFYGNLRIANNSVLRVAASSGAALKVQSGTFAPPLVAANNLLAVTGGSGQRAFEGPFGFPGTAAANAVYGSVYGSGLGTLTLGSLSAVQGTGYGQQGFLYPAASGALRNAAAATHLAANDFNGVARAGAGDIGAYEADSAINIGWVPHDAQHAFGALVCTPSTAQASYGAGQLMTVGLTIANEGQPGSADVFLGLVLPDGDTTVFFRDLTLTSLAVGSFSHPASWTPIAPSVPLTSIWSASFPDFFSLTWSGLEPTGTYAIRAISAATGSLLDDSIDPCDVLSSQVQLVTFTG